jgi:hypothetical protein
MQPKNAINLVNPTFAYRTFPLLYYTRSTSKLKPPIEKLSRRPKKTDSQPVCDNQCDNAHMSPENSTENQKKKVFAIGLLVGARQYLYRTNKKIYRQNDYLIILRNSIGLSNNPIVKFQASSESAKCGNGGILSIGKTKKGGCNYSIAKLEGGMR